MALVWVAGVWCAHLEEVAGLHVVPRWKCLVRGEGSFF